MIFLHAYISFFKSRVREPGLSLSGIQTANYRIASTLLLFYDTASVHLPRVNPSMTPSSEKSWQIPQTRDCLDWEALRLQSLAPGGFGSARAYIWHVLSSPSDWYPPLLFFFNIPSGQSYSTFTRTPWNYPRVRMNLSPIEMSVRYASIRIAASCSTP